MEELTPVLKAQFQIERRLGHPLEELGDDLLINLTQEALLGLEALTNELSTRRGTGVRSYVLELGELIDDAKLVFKQIQTPRT